MRWVLRWVHAALVVLKFQRNMKVMKRAAVSTGASTAGRRGPSLREGRGGGLHADEQALREFVEDVGLAMDGAGLPRAAGRVFGWLLVCDPPEQTATDLIEALESSTGGVSQSLRLLIHFKFVERFGRPGDRRSYYRVAPGAWERVMAAQQADTIRFRQLGERGLELLASAPGQRRRRLSEMTAFYSFLEKEMPALMQRWATTRGSTDD